LTTLGSFKSSLSLGPIAGIIHLIFVIIDMAMLVFFEYLLPYNSIEVATDFDYDRYRENKKIFGDHSFKVDKHIN
jgi:thiamine transporter ThiT